MSPAAALAAAVLGLSLALGAAPARAEPSASPVTLEIDATRVVPGRVSFRLTTNGLAGELDVSRLRVLVGDRALPVSLNGRRVRAAVPPELAGAEATLRVVLAGPGGDGLAVATERVTFAAGPAATTSPTPAATTAPAPPSPGPADPARTTAEPGRTTAPAEPAGTVPASATAAGASPAGQSALPGVPPDDFDLESAGGDAGSGQGLLVAAGVAFAAAAGIGLWLLFAAPGGRRNEFQRRLDTLRQFTDLRGTAPDEERFTAQTRLVLGMLRWIDARLTPRLRASIELSVERAGVSLDPAEWLLVRIAITVVSAVALGALFGSWFGLLVGALAGWVGCGQYLSFRAGRRSRAFTDQLPDSLRLMVGALRSGFTLNQAIDAVVREGQAPVSTELGRAMAETRLGDNLENALDRVGVRNNNPDVGWIVMAIRIQREVGGNLSEVLETAVHTMRERAKLGRHVRALSAEGRLSGLILFALPFLVAGVLLIMRPEYVRPLWTEPTGLLMVAVAAVLLTVGALWLRRLVEVKV